MRILHVIHSLHVGGAEKLLVDMLPVMRSRGHQVSLCLLQNCDTTFKDILLKKNIKVIIPPFNASRYSLRQSFFLKKLMIDFDIVHAHCMPATIVAALGSIGISCKPKLVLTLHSTSIAFRDKVLFRPFSKFVFSRYNKIIGCSQMATDAMVSVFPNCEVLTINNGINLSPFLNEQPANRELMVPDYSPSDIILCMVAGFREAKDQDCLIRSLLHLPKCYKLCLIGDGIRKPILENLILKLGLSSRVKLLGIRQDIPSLLKAVDFVVLSSHYEGLSLASIEGMASGHPFIASSVTGLKELVNGVGILFPESDDKALAKIIEKLASDSGQYDKIVRLCLNKAKEFDVTNTVDSYLSVYKQLLYEGA